VEIAPACRLQITPQLIPARFQAPDVRVPFDRLAARPDHAELVAVVSLAGPHFAREVFPASLE